MNWLWAGAAVLALAILQGRGGDLAQQLGVGNLGQILGMQGQIPPGTPDSGAVAPAVGGQTGYGSGASASTSTSTTPSYTSSAPVYVAPSYTPAAAPTPTYAAPAYAAPTYAPPAAPTPLAYTAAQQASLESFLASLVGNPNVGFTANTPGSSGGLGPAPAPAPVPYANPTQGFTPYTPGSSGGGQPAPAPAPPSGGGGGNFTP